MVSGWRKLPHPECLDLELAKPSYLTSGQVMSDPGSGLPMGSDEARVQFQFNLSLAMGKEVFLSRSISLFYGFCDHYSSLQEY